jgi:two-component system NarL family sensor kinase
MKLRTLIYLSLLSYSLQAQNLNIDSIKTLLVTARGEAKIQNLLDLCWELRFMNADTARLFGLEALKLARQIDNDSLVAQALHNVGVTYEAQGDYNDALQSQTESLELWRKLGNDLKIANTLNTIGIIHDERGSFKEALEFYHNARKIYEQAGNQGKIAMVLVNMGIVLKEQKDFAEAAVYYGDALRIYKKLGKQFGTAACYANLGSVYYHLPKYDSSLYYSLLATEAFKKQNVRQFLASSLSNTGMALHQLGRLAESKKYLNEALQLNEEYDNKKETSFTLTYLAKLHRAEGNLKEAANLASRGLSIATKINALQQVMEAEDELTNIYAAKKDFTAAFEHMRASEQVKDTLFNQEKAKQIAELQTHYETDKKENEIKLLKQENELKDSRLERNQYMVVSLVVVISGLIVLGFLWRNRMKLKQKVEIESTKAALRESQLQAVITSQEDERKRFAADLHDGMGQLISAVKLNLSKESVEKKSVDQAVEVLNEMNTEIRNIAFNLMPQVLIKGGLIEALQELAARINRSGKVQISVSAFDVPLEMPPDRKVALYRMCQEWLTNVLKYSKGSTVSLQLVQHSDELVITMEDNGEGFDPQRLSNSQGNGWRNIHSRLTLVHGQIEIDSQVGRKGTTVVISVPLFLVNAA